MNGIETHQEPKASRPGALLRGRRGFSLTELLVVIGIIVLLASLLLVALGRVRTSALANTTLSTMQGFAAACDTFHMEHGQYPGVIPERVLAAMDEPPISSTENALLHLMGGYRVLPPGMAGTAIADAYDEFDADYEIEIGSSPNNWNIKISLRRIGEGPMINGKPYGAYYTPGPREIGVVRGQVWQTEGPEAGWVRIPDLIDAWGQPILYTRQLRTRGPLVGEPDDRPQFVMGGMRPYLESGVDEDQNGLGELNQSQGESILTRPDPAIQVRNFAQILRHPAFGPTEVLEESLSEYQPRGAYVLISAGKDGIYFSAEDGPGRPGEPVMNIADGEFGNPSVVNEYNDIIFFGGG